MYRDPCFEDSTLALNLLIHYGQSDNITVLNNMRIETSPYALLSSLILRLFYFTYLYFSQIWYSTRQDKTYD